MQGAFAAQAESTIVKIPYNVNAENKCFFFYKSTCTRMDKYIQVELRNAKMLQLLYSSANGVVIRW